ncbi:hypothetical protein BaRGS_00018961 [Batillaria attramentaria]|uniref:AAA+ ATPase domain-containing protein n=1 Tax=Batillaria attramentaria TaxID=370345 RepID=A0ABD0KRE8_9CAEN
MASTAIQHYPSEEKRYRTLLEQASKRHEGKVAQALTELDSLMKGLSNKLQREKVFQSWCIRYADKTWPGIGETAYAVPPFYMNKYSDQLKVLPESEVRGDEAQRQVARAFRLLNNKFEEEGLPTMFIIGSCLYENVLLWLRKKGYQGLKEKDRHSSVFPHIIDEKGLRVSQKEMYFKIPDQGGEGQRHEADTFALHPDKGAIFVQVKAVDPAKCDEETTMKKIKKLIKQVERDEDVFKKVMGHRGDVMATQCTWVIALPNVARQRVKNVTEQMKKMKNVEDLVCTQTSDVCQKYSQEFLLGLDSFRAWWDKLESHKIDLDRIKETAASDTIRLTGRLVSRLLPTKEQEAILKTTKERRVHLVGAPCTGKTMLLVLKARNFAEKYKDSVIIVVNMHEVAEGRSVGHLIHEAIKDCPPQTFDDRVHHLGIKVADRSFEGKVEGLLKEKSRDRVLFIMDEVLPASSWAGIRKILDQNYKDSFVWCASDNDKEQLEGFAQRKLTVVHRCPPSVQHVLFELDDDKKASPYKPDCRQQGEISANGVTAICIRHSLHKDCSLKVQDCRQCGEELGKLLKNVFKVIATDEDDAARSSSRPKTRGASAEEEQSILPCSVTIAATRPSTTVPGAENLENCPLMKTLRNKLHVVSYPSDPNLVHERFWGKILVSDTDTFKGLEWEIVIFIPCEGARPEPQAQAKGIQTRPQTNTGPAEAESKKGERTRSRSPTKPEPTPSTSSDSPRSPKPLLKRQAGESAETLSRGEGMACKYWRGDDLKRFSDRDRKGLARAAATCTAQLVFFTP